MKNKFLRLIGLLFLVIIPGISVVINTNKEFANLTKGVLKGEFNRFFMFTETTKSSFSSFDLFGQMLLAKLKYNPLIIALPAALFCTALLAYVFRKKLSSKVDNDDMFRKLNMVYDENVEDGKDGKGKIKYKLVTHSPTLDFKKSSDNSKFVIKDVHPKIDRNVNQYLKGLLIVLKEKKKIEIDEGMIEATGFPGEYLVTLLTPELLEKQRGESVLKKAGLFFSVTVGDKNENRFPEIEQLDNGNLIINATKVTINKDVIERALNILSEEYKKKFFYVKDRSSGIFEVICSRKVDLLINYPEDISTKYKEFINGPIKKIQDLWEKEKQFYWFFGTLREGAIALKDNDLILSGDTLVHPMIIGTTGSGKTETLKTICLSLHLAYKENVEIYYANGTQSADLDPLCSNYSPMGKEAAKALGNTDNEKMVRLLNILKYAQEEADSRGLRFKEAYEKTGKECRKISDYRFITDSKMPEIVIAVDEFAGYSNIFKYDENYDKIGTIANLLQVAYSQYRKYGIHILIATQECKAASIPRRLFTNISGGLIMKIGTADYKYMGDSLFFDFQRQDPTTYKQGEGLFWSSEIECQATGVNRIPSTAYYIGKDIMKVINHTNIEEVRCPITPEGLVIPEIDWSSYKILSGNDNGWKWQKEEGTKNLICNYSDELFKYSSNGDLTKEVTLQNYKYPEHLKRDYDTDLLNLTDKDLDFTKLSLKNLQTVIEKTFLDREGWTVVRRENPNHKIVNLYARRSNPDVYIAIAFADSADVLTPNFEDRINRENTEETDMTVYFISGKTEGKKYIDVKEKLMEYGVCQVLIQSDYLMSLREAYDYFLEKKDTIVFTTLLESVDNQNQVRNEKMLNDLYKTNLSQNSMFLNKLNDIRANESSQKKGEAFEHFFIILERSEGHNTILGPELALKKYVNIKFANPRAEGGLDAFRWTDIENKKGIGFQLKNQTSKPLDTKVVDKMVKTKQLYESEGIIFEEFILVTTGTVTQQTKEEARKLGFGIIEGHTLDKIITTVNHDDLVKEIRKNRNSKDVAGIFTSQEIDSLDESVPKKIAVDKPAVALSWAKDIVGIEKDSDKKEDNETIHMSKESEPLDKSSRKDDVASKMREIFYKSKEGLVNLKTEAEAVPVNSVDDNEETLFSLDEKSTNFAINLDKVIKKEGEILLKTEDWDQVKNIPRAVDRKSIAIGLNYVKISGDKVIGVLVKEGKSGKKIGREISQKIEFSLKILKEYKIKINSVEFHYTGEVNSAHFDKKIKLIKHD